MLKAEDLDQLPQLRLTTLLIQASIETLLAFMHHFPSFALMLRVKDPSRLPGNRNYQLLYSHHWLTLKSFSFHFFDR